MRTKRLVQILNLVVAIQYISSFNLITCLRQFQLNKSTIRIAKRNDYTQLTKSYHSPSKKQGIFNEIEKSFSIGEEIQNCYKDRSSVSLNKLLVLAENFWIPSDTNLPLHFQQQHIHHERRQRWASQWIENLYMTIYTFNSDSNMGHTNCEKKVSLWEDKRFARVILASSIPFEYRLGESKTNIQSIGRALKGIHTLLGKSESIDCPEYFLFRWNPSSLVGHEILYGLGMLIKRAEKMSGYIPLKDAIEIRWAARGILKRLVDGNSFPLVPPDFIQSSIDEHFDNIFEIKTQSPSSLTDDSSFCHKSWMSYLSTSLPGLDNRASMLPFDIIPLSIDTNLNSEGHDEGSLLQSKHDLVPIVIESIPFKFDSITTKSGSIVQERRSTAWVAEEGIGSLAYSGKLMKPHPLPPIVRKLCRAVEQAIFVDDHDEGFKFFDCVLCNYYPDNEAACKFHTDPEHGTFWDRLTCVICMGDDRRFAFRPVPGRASWGSFDDKSDLSYRENENVDPAVTQFFPGDIVKMWGNCNDDFHHAVYKNEHGLGTFGVGRISLVLKRAMIQKSGNRGHGRLGEGRRQSKRKYKNRLRKNKT